MIAIPDPDVVFTDLGLAVLGGYLGWRLRKNDDGDVRPVLIMWGLASAAAWGALFHTFFPAKTSTPAGFAVWLGVALSVVVVAATLLSVCLSLRAREIGPRGRRGIVLGYGAVFLAVVVFVDESFFTIIGFYAPVLLAAVALAALEAVRARSEAWALVTAGLALSAVAALLQASRVAIHPIYFDHNAVYHVLQAIALVLLYLGFHERRTDPAARAG